MIVTAKSEPVLGRLRTATVGADSWVDLATCPVCGHDEHLEDIATIESGGVGGSVLAACVACEHLFKRRRPTSDWLDAYYAEEWDARGRQTNPRPRAKTKIVKFCQAHLKPGAKVLDMGAGFGSDLLGFREADFQTVGLESSRHRAAYVEDVLGIPCISAPFESAELPGDLDLIFSNHVMEHITDPATVIARAAEVLDEGALLYAAMPNCLSFEHALQFVHYAPHQSGFTPASLTRLLAAHGFEVVAAKATHELAVLARRTGDAVVPNGSTPLAREAFGTAVRAWVNESFGRVAGDKTLVWWRGRARLGRCYEGMTVPGGRRTMRALTAMREAHGRIPRNIDRRVRDFVPPRGNVRLLHVRVEGEMSLPVHIRYDGAEPPIWIK